MALNYTTRRPIFPAHMAEDNLVAPMRIVNGISDKGGEEFGRPWHGSSEIEECIDYGKDRVNGSCSTNSVPKDIVDLLPADPFGMDISTTFTAITGWLEDLEMDLGARGASKNGNEDSSLFAGFNLFWNHAMRFHTIPGYVQADKKQVAGKEGNCGSALIHYGGLEGRPAELNIVSTRTADRIDTTIEGKIENVAACSNNEDGEDGVLHEALFFAIGYLGVKDLLSVERVCKSMCSIVRGDPLLWQRIHIEEPLNDKITDDILLQLTNRAQGNLRCISLLQCSKITDDGLKRVLTNNPRVNKLCVPACTRLSIEGIVSIIKAYNTDKVSGGIRSLRIGGLYGLTYEQFDELLLLLGVNDLPTEKEAHKPHFYGRGGMYILCEDKRAIDIEVCPKCQKPRLVYDCPAEGCHMKEHTTERCRACALCIARCIQCGRCINDNEYEETFCLELLCSDCLNQFSV